VKAPPDFSAMETLDVLRLLLEEGMVDRRQHLSSSCRVVRSHPGWGYKCNCGHTELWQRIDALVAET
jgi:hypothetical protein